MQQITVEDRPGSRWITLQGDLDQAEVLHLKREFDQAIEGAVGEIVLDMSQVTFIGSLGIGLILATQEELTDQGRSFKLAGLSAFVEKTLDMMSIADVFERV